MSANEAIDELVGTTTPSPVDDPAWHGGDDQDDDVSTEADRFSGVLDSMGFRYPGDTEDEPAEPAGEQDQVDRLYTAYERQAQPGAADQQYADQAMQREQQLHMAYQQREAQLLAHLRAQQQAQAQQPEIDWDSDPRAYVQAREQQFAQELQQIRGELQVRQQADQAMQHIGNLSQQASALEAEFKKSTPDYEQALEHAVQHANAELRQRYPQATDQQVQQASALAMAQFVEIELQAGRNPAATLYANAQKRGFKSQPRQTAYDRQLAEARKIETLDAEQFEQLWSKVSRSGRPQFAGIGDLDL